MFSFRTTPIEEQLDRSLREGRVACFCTQNCWDPSRGRYLYDIFRERGNLAHIFSPRDSELTPETNHIDFNADELDGLEISVDVLGALEPIDSADTLDVKRYGVVVSHGLKRGLLLPNLEGVDTVEDQIRIARQKGGIGEHEPYRLERFEVVRHY